MIIIGRRSELGKDISEKKVVVCLPDLRGIEAWRQALLFRSSKADEVLIIRQKCIFTSYGKGVIKYAHQAGTVRRFDSRTEGA
jgi:hypothetical protein